MWEGQPKTGVWFLSTLPARASSQLQDLALSRHSFSFPADHSVSGFGLTSLIELFIQYFSGFQVEMKFLILHWLMLLPTSQPAVLQICTGGFVPQAFMLRTFLIHIFTHCCDHFIGATRGYLSVAVCLPPMKWVSSVKAVHGLCLRKDRHFADNSFSRRTIVLKSDKVWSKLTKF